MEEQSGIFRQKALERLSSPERLDQLVQVTSPKGWLALLTIFILVVIAIFWGFFGILPTKVEGTGILIKTGGVFQITSSVNGKIIDLSIKKGDVIRKGRVIARVEQTELLKEIYLTRSKLEESEIKAKKDLIFHKQMLKNFRERIAGYEKRLVNQKELLKEGLVTPQSVLETEQNIKDVKDEVSKAQLELLAEQHKLNELQRTLSRLKEQHEDQTEILSPYSGRVLEMKATIGDIVTPSKALASMELEGKDIKQLEAVLYIPAKDGKKVKPGMDANIAPSVINPTADGTILGKVTYVSPFPATSEAMMRVLQNEQLVRQQLAEGAPIEVEVHLIPDPSTPSGFKWTSAKGPKIEIQSGTLCTGKITVKKTRPINLVIPYLRKVAGY